MSAAALPRSVAVVGLGLIGASLLGALRSRCPEVRRLGVARRAEICRRALEHGLCDRAGVDAALLGEAEVVVLCTPVDAMGEWLARCREHAAGAALVTDVGSTKAWVMGEARRVLGAGRFLGGHPMAGRERSGYDAADPALFEGAPWVLTTDGGDGLDDRARSWRDCVERLGARALLMDAEVHDRVVASISHLPFSLSAALVLAATGTPAWELGAWRLAASGFRDATRLAGGDAAMYAAIVRTNRGEILGALDALESELGELRAALARPDGGAAYFARAARARAAWLERRAGSGLPVR